MSDSAILLDTKRAREDRVAAFYRLRRTSLVPEASLRRLAWDTDYEIRLTAWQALVGLEADDALATLLRVELDAALRAIVVGELARRADRAGVGRDRAQDRLLAAAVLDPSGLVRERAIRELCDLTGRRARSLEECRKHFVAGGRRYPSEHAKLWRSRSARWLSVVPWASMADACPSMPASPVHVCAAASAALDAVAELPLKRMQELFCGALALYAPLAPSDAPAGGVFSATLGGLASGLCDCAWSSEVIEWTARMEAALFRSEGPVDYDRMVAVARAADAWGKV